MKMRYVSAALGGMTLLVLLFSGCNLGLSEEDMTAIRSEYDYEAAPKEAFEAAGTQGEPFQVATIDAVGSLEADSDQVIKIEFVNGVVDSLDGVRLYPLTDAENMWEAYVRGDAIDFSAYIVALSNGHSEAYLTFDGTDVITTDTLEVYIPASVTASGGLKQLNQDGDSVAGETEDDVVEYLAVGGGLPAPVGQERDPRGSFTFSVFFDENDDAYDEDEYQGNDEPLLALRIEYSVPAGGATAEEFDGTISAVDAIRLQRRGSSTANWENVSLSIGKHATVDNADLLTIEDDLVDGNQYRWLVKNGWKSESWNGYPLFWGGDTDQHANTFADQWDSTEITGFTYYEDEVSDVIPQLINTQGGQNAFIDVRFDDLDDDEKIVRDTVTAERFVIWNQDKKAALAIDSLHWIAPDTVRLRLVTSSNNEDGDDIKLTIETGIKTERDDGEDGREIVNAFVAPVTRTGTL